MLRLVLGAEWIVLGISLGWLDFWLFQLHWFQDPPVWTWPAYIPACMFLIISPWVCLAFGIDEWEDRRR